MKRSVYWCISTGIMDCKLTNGKDHSTLAAVLKDLRVYGGNQTNKQFAEKVRYQSKCRCNVC